MFKILHHYSCETGAIISFIAKEEKTLNRKRNSGAQINSKCMVKLVFEPTE